MIWGFVIAGLLFAVLGSFRLWAEVSGLRSGTIPTRPFDKLLRWHPWAKWDPWPKELLNRSRQNRPATFWLVTVAEIFVCASLIAIGGLLIWLGIA